MDNDSPFFETACFSVRKSVFSSYLCSAPTSETHQLSSNFIFYVTSGKLLNFTEHIVLAHLQHGDNAIVLSAAMRVKIYLFCQGAGPQQIVLFHFGTYAVQFSFTSKTLVCINWNHSLVDCRLCLNTVKHSKVIDLKDLSLPVHSALQPACVDQLVWLSFDTWDGLKGWESKCYVWSQTARLVSHIFAQCIGHPFCWCCPSSYPAFSTPLAFQWYCPLPSYPFFFFLIFCFLLLPPFLQISHPLAAVSLANC